MRYVKQSISILLLVVICSCGSDIHHKEYYKDGTLKKTSTYSRADILQSISDYSTKGKLLQTTWFDESGDATCRYKYGDQTDLISYSTFYKNGTIKFIYDYYPDQLLKSEHYYSKSGLLLFNHKYQYDKYGRIVKDIRLNDEDTVVDYTVNEYDENGILLSQKWFNADDQIQYSYHYSNSNQIITYNEYDSQNIITNSGTFDFAGNTITYKKKKAGRFSNEFKVSEDEITVSKQDSKTKNRTVTVYDNNRNKIKQFVYNDTGTLSNEIVYNTRGKEKQKRIYDESGNLLYYIQYSYNHKGNISGLETFDASGDPITQL